MKKFFKALGWALLKIAVYFGASMIIGMIIGFIIVIGLMLKNPDILQNRTDFSNSIYSEIGHYTNIMVILTSVVSFFVILFIYMGRKKSLLKVCNFSKIKIKTIGLIVLLGIFFNALVSFILSYVTSLPALNDTVKSYEEVAKLLSGGNFIISLIAVVLVAPVFEEIFFRGVVFNELKNGMPLSVAIILQALIFGLFHGNLIQGSYAFFLAIFLCLVYIWCRSIWANIAFHFSFNLSGTIVDSIPDSLGKGIAGVAITIFLFLLTGLLLYIIYKNRVKSDEIIENNSLPA